MPFTSKAQMRKFFYMEKEGKIPKGKAKEWAHATKNIKNLPEHVSDKKKMAKGGSDDILAKKRNILKTQIRKFIK